MHGSGDKSKLGTRRIWQFRDINAGPPCREPVLHSAVLGELPATACFHECYPISPCHSFSPLAPSNLIGDTPRKRGGGRSKIGLEGALTLAITLFSMFLSNSRIRSKMPARECRGASFRSTKRLSAFCEEQHCDRNACPPMPVLDHPKTQSSSFICLLPPTSGTSETAYSSRACSYSNP